MADPQQDLDAFLTVVESKLRAPFSSLDWAKTATTAALRGTESTSEYLKRLGQVIGRTDKITQMRIIIGLLGIEDHEEEIAAILENVQQSESEEWVRIIAGLVQGILFQERGEQAASMLEKTCREVIDKVRDLEYETESLDEDDDDTKPYQLATADVEPTFAPYRYALLQRSLLEQAIPEIPSHAHFEINRDADILSMDEKLEIAKANEEQQHGLQAANMNTRQTSTASSNGSKDITTPIFPGNRLGKSNSAANAANKINRPKSSMFMPSKKPISMTTATKQPVKTTLHTRKAGAAQTLLAAKKRSRMMTAEGHGSNNASSGTSTSLTGATSTGGRAAMAKSKMKMIDVAEVQGLAKEKSQIAAASAATETRKSMSGLAGSLKRKAAASGEEKAKKIDRKAAAPLATAAAPATAPGETPEAKAQPVGDAAAATTAAIAAPPLQQAAGALASAALSAYQAQFAGTTVQQQQQQAAHAAKQQDWRQMLHEKSNKLSDEDRLRVQQFFVDRFNPTPDQPIYKLKLHEERTTDPKTGEPVKETFYLELDYSNFASKQFKKVKRYK